MPVGPGRPPIVVPTLASGGLLGAMPEYPIQITKVQAPPLRDETLARDRLLDWVAAKVHGRVVLVVAEAGYGKTTLLADFARRTRIRTLWFRLDRGDRDWVGFIAYLVAAVRVHLPGFAPMTDSLIRETGATPPSRDSVIDTFLRELAELPPDPLALILDDYHLVDEAPDVRHVMKELLARAPERLSFVFLSRRTPPLPLARLRALGEVATLGADDLRFDEGETDRLFRETYAMKLEPSLIRELSRRTEGWAASLQLVRTALRGRSAAETRAFIHAISGAEGDLYDYLAEEVVAELPDDLQGFLMRTSVLETVDTELGPVAAGIGLDDSRRLIDEGEALGLFGRRGPYTRYQVRAHPLVRDFLQARLARAVGPEGLRAIHLAVAHAADGRDWRVATHHYRAAGSDDDARRVLTDSIETILGTGAYAAADELATGLDVREKDAALLVLRSRGAQRKGELESALSLAEAAYSANPVLPAAILNLMTSRVLTGDVGGALDLGASLEAGGATRLALIGRAFRSVYATSVDGNLDLAADHLEELAAVLRAGSDQHFLGVTLSNLAYVRLTTADAESALAKADEAVEVLERSSAGIELVAALEVRAKARAFLGDLAAAREDMARAAAIAPGPTQIEVALEAASIETSFGSADRASGWLRGIAGAISPATDAGEQALLVQVFHRLRTGEVADAVAGAARLAHFEHRSACAFEAQRLALEATIAVATRDADAQAAAARASAWARRQGAVLWEQYADLLESLAVGDRRVVDRALARVQSPVVTMAAEAVSAALHSLSPRSLEKIRLEAHHRPERWRDALRGAISQEDRQLVLVAGALLEEIGEQSDVSILRSAARRFRLERSSSDLGRSLARRLAPRVLVDDLGRVSIRIGDRVVEGRAVRRKVLALLCYLLTRPRFASTREEVLDALWPDLDPDSGLNSLNQTVYFLRRVFDPEYDDEVSPRYVDQDSEMVWLDPELLDARSRKCRDLIKSTEGQTWDGALRLAREYRAKFALDFAYEEWAVPFRDALHASFLRVVEHAIQLDIQLGHLVHATELAELASEAEPDAEELQVALLRLYRMTGAHAAAAERYSGYAASLRELGVEPAALEDL